MDRMQVDAELRDIKKRRAMQVRKFCASLLLYQIFASNQIIIYLFVASGA